MEDARDVNTSLKKGIRPRSRLDEAHLPALFRLALDAHNLVLQRLGTRVLLALLPAIVGAPRHVVRDHVLGLIDHPLLLLRERGLQIELGNVLALATAHLCSSRCSAPGSWTSYQRPL